MGEVLPAIRRGKRVSPWSLQGRRPDDQPPTEGSRALPRGRGASVPGARGSRPCSLRGAVNRPKLECWERAVPGPADLTGACARSRLLQPARVGVATPSSAAGRNRPGLNPAREKVTRRESERDVPAAAGGAGEAAAPRASVLTSRACALRRFPAGPEVCAHRAAQTPGASGRDLVTHTPRRPPRPALDRTSSRGQGSTGNRVSWGQRGPQLGHRRASSGDAVTGRGGRAERGRAAESAQGGHWLAGEQGHPRLALIGREVRPSSVQRAVAGSRCSSREGAGVSAPCPGRGRHFRLESHVRGRGPRGRGAAGVLRARSPPPPPQAPPPQNPGRAGRRAARPAAAAPGKRRRARPARGLPCCARRLESSPTSARAPAATDGGKPTAGCGWVRARVGGLETPRRGQS